MNLIAGSRADAKAAGPGTTGGDEPVFCIMGPTASGKTDIAQALCDRFPFEIVSVDAAMVYRGLDIGTAKPGPELRQRCPHYLVDIVDPQTTYSAAEFVRDVRRVCADISARKRWPLLVGGTMFYFNVLEAGVRGLPAADGVLRAQLAERGATQGWPALHAQLARIDPQRAATIEPQDRQRIQRALEICLLTGQAVTPRPQNAAGLHLIKIALAAPERAWLHRRIAARFQLMLEAGLLEEVKGLLNQEVPLDSVALRTVGYRQAIEYLQGKVSYNEFVSKAVAATRQLAKRQLTWLRNQSGVTWMDCTHGDFIGQLEAYIANKRVLVDQGP